MLAVIKYRVFCIGSRYYLPGSNNSYFSAMTYMALSIGFNPDPQRTEFCHLPDSWVVEISF